MPRQVTVYDWEEVESALFEELKLVLINKGMDVPDDIYGGYYHKTINKWVESAYQDNSGNWISPPNPDIIYVNYWHEFLNHWGEHIRNDSIVRIRFDSPAVDIDEDNDIKVAMRNAIKMDCLRKFLVKNGTI